ncbi:MAG: histidine kinase [Kofleriaceae bacterium]
MADRQPIAPASTRRLPRELILLYLVGPFFATPIVEGDFFEYTPIEMVRAFGRNAIIFLWIPASIHALYRFIMPVLLPHVKLRVLRLLVHAGLTGLVAAGGALSLRPLLGLLSGDSPELTSFVFRCVTFTWAIVLPALVVQSLRTRAEAIERRLTEQRQAALSAQLEAIQARTNPHFMFNAMNTIASLVKDDPKLAEQTIERLADVLRYALQSARLEAVTLGEELAMIRDYLEIQHARFGDRLRYTIEVEPGLDLVRVPPLLVQPLIENAVLHGVGERQEGGSIALVARRRADRIEISVDDDGPGPGASSHRGSGTSLDDLARRLELLHGGAGSLVIRTNDRGGFRVDLGFPVPGSEG